MQNEPSSFIPRPSSLIPRADAVQGLFDKAVELPPEERAAFLDAACRGDAGLRAEVESLLAYDRRTQTEGGGLLNSPLVRAPENTTGGFSAGPPPEGTGIPQWIGHYRILRCVGEGGMGIVYEAEQDNPRRPVALKVIRPGFASSALLKRFGQEAQILGRLHHPGIAPIYEAGMAEDGRPFFAMEFIRGLPLDDYARHRSLTLAARLDLLARVCEAVQYAHDQGIIHRDLKPSNIVVDDSGQPKVLDFGVARTTDADVQTASGRTQTGQLLGTLLYMSPEQVAGDPAALDRRSDVYALGVILFELLADRLPYHLEHLPLPEVARLIREQEPSRLGSINAVYRGDVETIVGKALEKDKARRYGSAGELAADIRRHLNNEPILARPPSALYHLEKFVRRHTALVGGVFAVMAALVLGLIGTILFAVEAGHNAQAAIDKEKEARYQTYRARLAAATAALTGHDVSDAARQLDEAPEELRGWEWHYLHSRLDDSTAMFPVEALEALQLARSPDGLRLVAHTASRVRLLDLEGHELLSQSFQTKKKWLYFNLSKSASPRSLELVGDTIEVADNQGRVQARLQGLPKMIAGPRCLSADGSRLAVGWDPPFVFGPSRWVIALYDLNALDKTPTCANLESFSCALALSPDGKRVASAGEDSVARVFDCLTGSMLAECRGHRGRIMGVAFSSDGKRLVTASGDGSVRQWDPATGREVAPPYERHTGEVFTAAYSSDGERIASGGTDRTVRVWRAADRQDVSVLHGHTGVLQDVAFTPDGRRVVSLSPFIEVQGSKGDGTVRLWESLPEASLPMLVGHTKYVYAVAYSPDGRWIASGSWDHTVRLWDARTGEPCATLRQTGNVRALSFSPDGSWLACSCDGSEQLQVWDLATGQRRREVQGPGNVVLGLAVSTDGAKIAAVARGGTASVTDPTTGGQIASWRIFGDWAEKKGLAYSPDGRWLAGMGEDAQTIDIWDAQTYQRAARLTGHTGPVHSIAFSPDGRRLVSASGDRTVRIWEVATLACVAVLKGHTDEVFAAVFHPDGKRVASAGRDRAVWLWDIATGQEVARLQGHTDYVFSLAFSPDGKSLVSGSGDGTVRLWDTEPLKQRYQARREAEALRPEAERLVARLFQEKKDAAAVVAALRADGSLSEPLRHAALRAVLRRGSE